MKAYLLTSGTLFALMATSHIFITVEHLGREVDDIWFILGPVIVIAISAAFATWAFSLVRRVPAGRADR